MDFGNQSLQAFAMAPQVGGMVLPDDSERIGRCFSMLKVQMEQRKKQMRGGTYEQYRLRASERLPAILLLKHSAGALFKSSGSVSVYGAFASDSGADTTGRGAGTWTLEGGRSGIGRSGGVAG